MAEAALGGLLRIPGSLVLYISQGQPEISSVTFHPNPPPQPLRVVPHLRRRRTASCVMWRDG